MRNLRRALSTLAVVVPLVTAAGCRAPTEIVFAFSTDEPCERVSATAVTVGSVTGLLAMGPSATSAACAAGHIGTLVVVPSGGDEDEVALRIVAGLGRDPVSCEGTGFGKGCIEARRAIRFVPHTPLRLEVPLRAVCDAGLGGGACSPANSLCALGCCPPWGCGGIRCNCWVSGTPCSSDAQCCRGTCVNGTTCV